MNPISDVLKALSEANVRFVVVGGVAAVMQGVERVTYDLDLVIELTRESCEKAIDQLLAIGYRAIARDRLSGKDPGGSARLRRRGDP